VNRRAHICFYGLYATLNADYLLRHGADSVLGGEYEAALVELVSRLARERQRRAASPGPPGSAAEPAPAPLAGPPPAGAASPRGAEPALPLSAAGPPSSSLTSAPILRRLSFPPPSRTALPPLGRYAHLEKDGASLAAGYVEASRGCLHRCLHCPIPPVYGGRFFVVPEERVLEDIRGQIAAGARHITFGDPDFLNGPQHALRVARALHRDHPGVSFDITTKVEHILERRELFPELAGLGCAFLVSAVESLSDRVLERLEKGHTRAGVEEALDILEAAGIPMRPSLLPFTPWSTLEDYFDLLELVERRGLIYQVDPVQYSIRLLVPPGSALLSKPETRAWLGPLDEGSFTYRWIHHDPRMDALHTAVSALVERAACTKEDAGVTFSRIRTLARSVREGRLGDSPDGRLGGNQAGRHADDPRRSPARAALEEGGAEDAPSAESPLPVPPTRKRAPRLSESWFC